MSDLKFESADGKYQVYLPETVLRKMLNASQECERFETGGIVVGHYNRKHDCALITDVSDAPIDSASSRSWFRRGVAGLQGVIGLLWNSGHRRYYLGEWHYHPGNSTTPSGVDISTMWEIAASEHYKCPEPIAIIVSGVLSEHWGISVWVFPRNAAVVELQMDDD